MIDLEFIEKFRAEALKADENNLRAQLAGEARKHQRNERAIERLQTLIAESSATKREHQRLQAVAEELPRYIEMIK